MKKIILAPDSFKGTISAKRVCEIWTKAIKEVIPDARIISLPMADGGEGMVESYLNFSHGEKRQCKVSDPIGRKITATYGIINNNIAVMEMAAAAGLPLMGEEKNIMNSSTYGVGEMILDGLKRGVSEFIMGIGGSATNDCGIGMAEALGYKFMSNGNQVRAIPENMSIIDQIIKPANLPEIKITAACDVDNPLYGENGATKIFGPQKGADETTIPLLEEGIKNISSLINENLGVNVSEIPGAGAAGGLGAGLVAFLGGKLLRGIDLMLDTAGFNDMLEDASMVITGEGRMDGQSLHGKVPFGIGTRAKAKGIPCIALCGSFGDGYEKLMDHGITACFSAVKSLSSFDKLKLSCEEDLYNLTKSFLKIYLL